MKNNYLNSDEVLFDKLHDFTLIKDDCDYKSQIEEKLKYLADICKSDIPLMTYQYKIIEEFNDTVIAQLNDKGNISVNDF